MHISARNTHTNNKYLNEKIDNNNNNNSNSIDMETTEEQTLPTPTIDYDNINNVNNNNNSSNSKINKSWKKRTNTPWIGNILNTTESFEFYLGLKFVGIDYYTDSIVMLNKHTDKDQKASSSTIYKISSFFENRMNGIAYVELVRVYRPEETDQGRKPFHGSKELIPSKDSILIKIENIKRLVYCTVQPFTEYSKRIQYPMNAFYCQDDKIETLLNFKAKHRLLYDSIVLEKGNSEGSLKKEETEQEEQEQQDNTVIEPKEEQGQEQEDEILQPVFKSPKKRKDIESNDNDGSCSGSDNETTTTKITTPSKKYKESPENHKKTIERLNTLGKDSEKAIENDLSFHNSQIVHRNEAIKKLLKEKERKESPVKKSRLIKQVDISDDDFEDYDTDQNGEIKEEEPIKLDFDQDLFNSQDDKYFKNSQDYKSIIKTSPIVISDEEKKEIVMVNNNNVDQDDYLPMPDGGLDDSNEYRNNNNNDCKTQKEEEDDGFYEINSSKFVNLDSKRYDNDNNQKITNFFKPKSQSPPLRSQTQPRIMSKEEIERIQKNKDWNEMTKQSPKKRVLQFEKVSPTSPGKFDPVARAHLFSMFGKSDNSKKIDQYFTKKSDIPSSGITDIELENEDNDAQQYKTIIGLDDYYRSNNNNNNNNSRNTPTTTTSSTKSISTQSKKRKMKNQNNSGSSEEEKRKPRLKFDGEVIELSSSGSEKDYKPYKSTISPTKKKTRVVRSSRSNIDTDEIKPRRQASKRSRHDNSYFVDNEKSDKEDDDYELDDFVVDKASDCEGSSEEEPTSDSNEDDRLQQQQAAEKHRKSKRNKKEKQHDRKEKHKKIKILGPVDIDSGLPIQLTGDSNTTLNSQTYVSYNNNYNNDSIEDETSQEGYETSNEDEIVSDESKESVGSSPIVDQQPKRIKEKVLKEFSKQMTVKEAFDIFIQYIISSLLDEDFAIGVMQDKDEYFLDAITRVKRAVVSKKEALVLSSMWHDEFLRDITHRPFFHLQEYNEHDDFDIMGVKCKSCNKTNHNATKRIFLSGRSYQVDDFWSGDFQNPKRLKGTSKEPSNVEYDLGAFCFKRSQLFHQLHHFPYKLFRDIKGDVRKLQQEHSDWTNKQILFYMIGDDSDGNSIDDDQDSTSYIPIYFMYLEELLSAAEKLEKLSIN